jgi:hypothetical protein
MIMWLKNRRPKEWRDRHNVTEHVEVDNEGPTDHEIARALALLLAQAKAHKLKLIEAENGPDGKRSRKAWRISGGWRRKRWIR